MDEMVSGAIAALGLMAGLLSNSYACKVSNSSFFLSSTLTISMALTLFGIVTVVRSKTKISIISVFIGIASALIDTILLFVYTRILSSSSLLFCVVFIMYQMVISLTTCYMPQRSSMLLMIICAIFVYPIVELDFAERNGFPFDLVPKIVRGYLTNTETNTVFVPAMGFKLLLVELSKRVESDGSSGLFGSMVMFLMGSTMAALDVPAFSEELANIGPVIKPFILSHALLFGSAVLLRLKDISLVSMYLPMCVLFVIISLAFCSSMPSWLWQKTVTEEALTGPYVFFLFTFVPFLAYTFLSYKPQISRRFSRESFLAGIFTSL